VSGTTPRSDIDSLESRVSRLERLLEASLQHIDEAIQAMQGISATVDGALKLAAAENQALSGALRGLIDRLPDGPVKHAAEQIAKKERVN